MKHHRMLPFSLILASLLLDYIVAYKSFVSRSAFLRTQAKIWRKGWTILVIWLLSLQVLPSILCSMVLALRLCKYISQISLSVSFGTQPHCISSGVLAASRSYSLLGSLNSESPSYKLLDSIPQVFLLFPQSQEMAAVSYSYSLCSIISTFPFCFSSFLISL